MENQVRIGNGNPQLYIGSSQTNSVLELAFGYNGIPRLTGQGGPGGGNRTGDDGQT